MDAEGYPEDEELESIKGLGFDFKEGCETMLSFFEATGYGSGALLADGSFELHTGGWSGCEDMISSAMESMWWPRYWYSTTRGGHFLFKE